MKVISSISRLRREVGLLKRKGMRVGFVPTMGALHEGHLSLIRKARKDNDVVVVSIFVNPTQFGPGEDFSRYPRNFKRDRALCKAEGVDIIFYPSTEEMYPQPYRTFVEVEQLDEYLCGRSRPGHFRGVCSVVAKLFNIVSPDIAYFGQKDIQQAIIIKQMIKDLNFPVKMKIMPIVREKDGLAMSSRNTYLSEEERKEATVLYRSLCLAKDMIRKGERRPGRIIKKMQELIENTSGRIDYIEMVDMDSLSPIKKLKEQDRVIIALAVWFGKARLIDNIIVTVR